MVINSKIRLGTSDNRGYLAMANAFAQIPHWGTSDTLGTLGEMHLLNLENAYIKIDIFLT